MTVPKITGGVVHDTVSAARKLVGRKSSLGQSLRSTNRQRFSSAARKVNTLSIPAGVRNAAMRDNLRSEAKNSNKASIRQEMRIKLKNAGLMEKSPTRNGLRLKRVK